MLSRFAAIGAILSIGLFAAACGADSPTPTQPAGTPTATPSQTATATAQPGPQNFTVAFSEKPRVESPAAPQGDVNALVTGNSAFAVNLYKQLSSEDGNLFMSPYSISLALAMTYAGARGETATEMADALQFTLAQARLHAAFNALDQALASRGEDQPEDQKFTLEVANSIWGQQGFAFQQDFLDALAENYGAGMRLVDYVQAAEEARLAINAWVEENTNGRIEDLIPPGAIDDMTRLVLANAIYFKAAWRQEFNPDLTQDADFHLLNGGTVTTPLMHMTSHFNYGEGDGYQAIEIPYVGSQTSMVVLLPDQGGFEEFESGLTPDMLREIIADMSYTYGDLALPKFQFESKFSLPAALKALGMEQAFDATNADLSGISTAAQLYITDIIHQSFVAVDEQGTEAAAATAVIVGTTSMPVDTFDFIADRPFIFLIRDIETGTVLFMGRLLEPGA